MPGISWDGKLLFLEWKWAQDLKILVWTDLLSFLSTSKSLAVISLLFPFPPASLSFSSLSPFFTCALYLQKLLFNIFFSFLFIFVIFFSPFIFPFIFSLPFRFYFSLSLSINLLWSPLPSFQTWCPLKVLSCCSPATQQCSVPYLQYPLYYLHTVLLVPNYHPLYPQLFWNCFFKGY